jgi:hypothetical protein
VRGEHGAITVLIQRIPQGVVCPHRRNVAGGWFLASRLLRNTRACARGHPRSAMPDRKLVMPSSWAYVPPRSAAARGDPVACRTRAGAIGTEVGAGGRAGCDGGRGRHPAVGLRRRGLGSAGMTAVLHALGTPALVGLILCAIGGGVFVLLVLKPPHGQHICRPMSASSRGSARSGWDPTPSTAASAPSEHRSAAWHMRRLARCPVVRR